MSDDEEVEIVRNPNVFWWPSQPYMRSWQTIIVDEDRRQMDGPIQEVDVVRPDNHMYTTNGNEIEKWRLKSTMRCPTYGNCTYCIRSGPTGMACGFCQNRAAGYLCVYIFRNFKRQLIDAQWLAGKLFRDGHVTAMANRKVGWLRTPLISTRDDELGIWVRRFFPNEQGTSDEVGKLACDAYRQELIRELTVGWYGSE